jgi:hypothetical protein
VLSTVRQAPPRLRKWWFRRGGDELYGQTQAELFAFDALDEAVAALEAIESDYDRHSRAAAAIAEEYVCAETVLTRLIQEPGL